VAGSVDKDQGDVPESSAKANALYRAVRKEAFALGEQAIQKGKGR
jgi:hypothetical protein